MARERFFFKNHVENEAETLVPDLFLFFQKALFEIKQVVCSLVLIYFDIPQLVKK